MTTITSEIRSDAAGSPAQPAPPKFEVIAERYIDDVLLQHDTLRGNNAQLSLYGLTDGEVIPDLVASGVETVSAAFKKYGPADLAFDQAGYGQHVEHRLLNRADSLLAGLVNDRKITRDIIERLHTMPYSPAVVKKHMDQWFSVATETPAGNTTARLAALVSAHYGSDTQVPFSPDRHHELLVDGQAYKAYQLLEALNAAQARDDSAGVQALLDYMQTGHGRTMTVREISSYAAETKAMVAENARKLARQARARAEQLGPAMAQAGVHTAAASEALGLAVLQNKKVIARAGLVGAVAAGMIVPGTGRAFAAEKDSAASVATGVASTLILDSAQPLIDMPVIAEAPAQPNPVLKVEAPTPLAVSKVAQAPDVAPPVQANTLLVMQPSSDTQTQAPAPLESIAVTTPTPQPEATASPNTAPTTDPTAPPTPETAAPDPIAEINQAIANGDLTTATNKIITLYGGNTTPSANPKLAQYGRLLLQDFTNRLSTDTAIDASRAQQMYKITAYANAGLKQPTVLSAIPADMLNGELKIALDETDTKILAQKTTELSTSLNAAENGSLAGYSDTQKQVLTQLLAETSVALMTAAEHDAAVAALPPPEAPTPAPTPETPSGNYSEAAENAANAKGAEIDQQIANTISGLDLSNPKKQFIQAVADVLKDLQGQDLPVNLNVMFAQAINESSYGQSGLASKYNNLFGMKAGGGWTGETISLPTTEVINGKTVDTTALWRVYPSIEDSVKDYIFNFIGAKPHYADAVQFKDDENKYLDGLLAQLKSDGSIAIPQGQSGAMSYATDPKYKEKTIALIDQLKIRDTTGMIVGRAGAMQAERDRVKAEEEAAAEQERLRQAANKELSNAEGQKLLDMYVNEAANYRKAYAGIDDYQCVSFIKFIMMKYSQMNPDDGSFTTMGHGKYVAGNLDDNGYTVDHTPAVLAVVSGPHIDGGHFAISQEYGHVALVIRVNDDGSIDTVQTGTNGGRGKFAFFKHVEAWEAAQLTYAHTETDLAGILADVRG